ncbi:MAG TPA: glycosyl transferase [Terrisporobacter glycolicus]|nr:MULTISPECIES: glycosyltransferase [Terrisporobacter]HBI93590.1 glycosyl transferase [Terrisporobacter hibernicus]
MIPKIIHYCWFGRGAKPKLAKKCIESWKKYCPDYRIIEWNEDNFEVEKYPYAKYCLEHGKWAFLSDFVRLKVVCEHGGIYFDTDVELTRKIDELLIHEAFYGFENDNYVNSGLGFGSVAYHKVIVTMLDQYNDLEPNSNGQYKMIGCPILNTKAMISLGLVLNGALQKLDGALILPQEYLNPFDDATGILKKTRNTYSIHWYSKSALDKASIIRSRLTRLLHRIFGVDLFRRFR